MAALRLSGSPWRATLGWTALCVGVVILPSLALLAVERWQRGDGDWFVTVREQRRGLYALGGACLLTLLGLLLFLDAPRILLAGLAGGIAANTLGALLNRVSKVSVHTGAVAGSAVLLAHVAPVPGALLGACTLLVAFARVRLGHHTPAQVATGAGVSAACVLISLRAFD